MRRAPDRIHTFPPRRELSAREEMAPEVGDQFAGGVIAEMWIAHDVHPRVAVRISLTDGSTIDYAEGPLGAYELVNATLSPGRP